MLERDTSPIPWSLDLIKRFEEIWPKMSFCPWALIWEQDCVHGGFFSYEWEKIFLPYLTDALIDEVMQRIVKK